ncbi:MULTISPECIES: hypothetical protein [unclassified Thioalkalivibrio]|uniref:hypothetical protein n=1 Tax=unclassified Thioalkalivibrio TaxID=2621013 RepID=UPI000367E843|nr:MULTISPECIES: hypothetical protein [unclassified Thioalkalivibrio]
MLETKGDCCEAAIHYLDYLIHVRGFDRGDLYVAHGLVTGTGGEVANMRYGHAWVEHANGIVFDFSNGHSFVGPKDAYYRAGQIDPEETIFYSHLEAHNACIEHGTYGPWDDALGAKWIPEEVQDALTEPAITREAPRRRGMAL